VASLPSTYTGGLFTAGTLELYATQPRLLTAESFGVGFRWSKDRPGSTRVLWHPELQKQPRRQLAIAHRPLRTGRDDTPSVDRLSDAAA
jgi:hypothetical protein